MVEPAFDVENVLALFQRKIYFGWFGNFELLFVVLPRLAVLVVPQSVQLVGIKTENRVLKPTSHVPDLSFPDETRLQYLVAHAHVATSRFRIHRLNLV